MQCSEAGLAIATDGLACLELQPLSNASAKMLENNTHFLEEIFMGPLDVLAA